jgi:hypothetical protein
LFPCFEGAEEFWNLLASLRCLSTAVLLTHGHAYATAARDSLRSRISIPLKEAEQSIPDIISRVVRGAWCEPRIYFPNTTRLIFRLIYVPGWRLRTDSCPRYRGVLYRTGCSSAKVLQVDL